MTEWLRRLRYMLNRGRFDQELADDLEFHREMAARLEAWCAARLAKAKRPGAYRFVDELPRTSVGKIKKYQLRQ